MKKFLFFFFLTPVLVLGQTQGTTGGIIHGQGGGGGGGISLQDATNVANATVTSSAALSTVTNSGTVSTNQWAFNNNMPSVINSGSGPMLGVNSYIANSGVLPTENWVTNYVNNLITNALFYAGYRWIEIDDGWMQGRSNNFILANPTNFPDGMGNTIAYCHSRGVKVSLYTDVGSNSVAGYTGSLGYETNDIWQIGQWGADAVFSDAGNNTNAADIQFRHTMVSWAIRQFAPNMLYIPLCSGLSATYGDTGYGPTGHTFLPWMPSMGPAYIGYFHDSTANYTYDQLRALTNSLKVAPYLNKDCRLHIGGMTFAAGDLNNWEMFASIKAMFHGLFDTDIGIPYLTNSAFWGTYTALTNQAMISIDGDSTSYPKTAYTNGAGASVIYDTLASGQVAALIYNNLTNTAQVGSFNLSLIGLTSGNNYSVSNIWTATTTSVNSNITFSLPVGDGGFQFLLISSIPVSPQPQTPVTYNLVWDSPMEDSNPTSFLNIAPQGGLGSWVNIGLPMTYTNGILTPAAILPGASGGTVATFGFTNVAVNSGFSMEYQFSATNIANLGGLSAVSGGNNAFQLNVWSDSPGDVKFNLWNTLNSVTTAQATINYTNGTRPVWHEALATFNCPLGSNGTMTVYVDGKYGASATLSGWPAPVTGLQWVTGASNPLWVARPRLWNRSLSQNEAAALFSSDFPVAGVTTNITFETLGLTNETFQFYSGMLTNYSHSP